MDVKQHREPSPVFARHGSFHAGCLRTRDGSDEGGERQPYGALYPQRQDRLTAD